MVNGGAVKQKAYDFRTPGPELGEIGADLPNLGIKKDLEFPLGPQSHPTKFYTSNCPQHAKVEAPESGALDQDRQEGQRANTPAVRQYPRMRGPIRLPVGFRGRKHAEYIPERCQDGVQ